jgi:hypothetical protein
MRRMTILLAMIAALALIGGSSYETTTYKGGGAGGGGGVKVAASLAGNGEAPSITLKVNLGVDVAAKLAYMFDGKEMWSSADIAYNNALEDTTATAAKIRETFDLPWDTYAFDGDSLHVWVTLYNEDGDAFFTHNEGFAFDLPGEIKHAIVQASNVGSISTDLYDQYVAAGATEYDLIDEVDYAWVALDETDWDGWDNISANNWSLTGVDPGYTLPVDGGETRLLLARAALEDIIPAGSTVLDARFNVHAASNIYYGTPDSLVAILNTQPGDNLWWQSDNIGGWSGEAGCTFSSWKYQIQGYDDTVDAANATAMQAAGYPATSEGEWDLDNRTSYWDWGIPMFANEPRSDTGFAALRWADGECYGWPIGPLVQRAVNGETHNGILYTWRDADRTTQVTHSVQHSGSVVTAELPYYTVSWIEGVPYDPVYPDGPSGHEAVAVMVFTSDDGRVTDNDNWVAEFQERGLRYTLGLQHQSFDDPNYPTTADALRWIDAGMDIANHSRHGWNTTEWDTTGTFDGLINNWAGLPAECDTFTRYGEMDQYVLDYHPCWMQDRLGYTPRTSITNLGVTTLPAVWATNRMGYGLVRRTSYNNATVDGSWPNGGWYYYGIYTSDPADVSVVPDTTYTAWPAHNALQPWLLHIYTPSAITNELVGARDVTLTDAQIAANVKRKLATIVGRRIGALAFFSHDEKGASYIDQNGITAAEMAVVLDAVEDLNVAVLAQDEFDAWRRSLVYGIATPSTWGSHSDWHSTDPSDMHHVRLRWVKAAQVQGIKRQGS